MIKQSCNLKFNFNKSKAYTDSDVSTRRYLYSTVNNMGILNKYCMSGENEAPVCPPMWYSPLQNAMLLMPPSVPMPGREKPMYTERVLRRPINPFPEEDPDLNKKNNAAPGAASAGNSKDEDSAINCRECGPKILGVIGVPNSDPNAPWPERNADGSEENPFTSIEDMDGLVQAPIRVPGRWVVEYENFLQSQLIAPIILSTALLKAEDGELFATYDGPVQLNPTSSGTIYILGETIKYTSVRDGWFNPQGDTVYRFAITRELPIEDRVDHEEFEELNAVDEYSYPTGNTSAGIAITVDNLGQVFNYNINFETNVSRGMGFENDSLLIVQNTEMGGVPGSGAVIINIKTTHWPDEDVSSCILSGLSANVKEYCCFQDNLTPSDWTGGAGRCASLAQYGVARPGEWVQNCPPGYEYTPGVDGLFCTKCKNNTSSFDPTVETDNCPVNGVGCQKCCDNPGILCS